MEKHGPRGRIIPPAPEKSLMGTTRVKINSNSFDGNSAAATQYRMASQQTDEALGERKSEKEFIARRRVALERFVNRVAHHPVLRKDSTFMEFLESTRDLPRATSTSALSSASVFRLIGKFENRIFLKKIVFRSQKIFLNLLNCFWFRNPFYEFLFNCFHILHWQQLRRISKNGFRNQ